jgi:crotonobetainyl-CoA:carnitine CoA-transferase CaiB-like acyl-CoA transferase
VGEPEIADEPGYATNVERRGRRAEIVRRIQAILLTKPRAHWLAVLTTAGVPAGPINGVDEVVRDEHLLSRGLFYNVPSDTGDIPQVGTGFLLDGEFNCPRLAPPAHGEHTTAVLRELLGCDAATIEKLAAKGIIAGRAGDQIINPGEAS